MPGEAVADGLDAEHAHAPRADLEDAELHVVDELLALVERHGDAREPGAEQEALRAGRVR